MATLMSLRQLTASRPQVPNVMAVARARRRRTTTALPRLADNKRRLARRPSAADRNRNIWWTLTLGAAVLSAVVLVGGFPTAPSALPAGAAKSSATISAPPAQARTHAAAKADTSAERLQGAPSVTDATTAATVDPVTLTQRLTGRWLYELNHQRGRVRELIALTPDGYFTSQILVERAGQPVAYRAEAGRWSVEGKRLRRSYQQANGVELEEHLQNELTVEVDHVDAQTLVARVLSREEGRQGKLSYQRVDDQMELPDPDA